MLELKLRYGKLIRHCPEVRDPRTSVLEVGGGGSGIAQFLQRPVQGLTAEPTQSQTPWLSLDTGDVRDMPYPNDTFDVVVCADAIQALPAADWPRAIAELVRVAKQKVVISVPCDYPGMEGELALANWYDSTGRAKPEDLLRNLAGGMPKVGAIFAAVSSLELPFDVFGNEGMIQHYGAVMLEREFSFAGPLASNHLFKAPQEEPVFASEWDMVYSYAFCVYKQATRPKLYRNLSDPSERGVREARVGTYAALHKRSLLGDFGQVRPIMAGEAAATAEQGELTDRLSTGERLLNTRWSELSAIYRIWREGPVTDVVGFFHYRRFFDFSVRGSSRYRTEIKPEQVSACSANFLHDGVREDALGGRVILPFPTPVTYSPFNHYATYHNPHDLCRVLSLMAWRAPELLPYTDNLFNGNSLFCHNMFIMKWDLFDELCKVWFGILQEFESQVPSERATSYQNRDISFLAERIFDVWIRYAADRLGAGLMPTTMYFVDY